MPYDTFEPMRQSVLPQGTRLFAPADLEETSGSPFEIEQLTTQSIPRVKPLRTARVLRVLLGTCEEALEALENNQLFPTTKPEAYAMLAQLAADTGFDGFAFNTDGSQDIFLVNSSAKARTSLTAERKAPPAHNLVPVLEPLRQKTDAEAALKALIETTGVVSVPMFTPGPPLASGRDDAGLPYDFGGVNTKRLLDFIEARGMATANDLKAEYSLEWGACVCALRELVILKALVYRREIVKTTSRGVWMLPEEAARRDALKEAQPAKKPA